MLAADPAALRHRLARLLGMLGSDHDGEALNAARLADRLVRGSGLTWSEVLSFPRSPAPSPSPDHPRSDDPFVDWPGGWRGAVAHCLRYGDGVLTGWERAFCTKVSGYVASPTPKQQMILRRLLDRVVASNAEGRTA